jgi:uncharacterized cupin superfamily protein
MSPTSAIKTRAHMARAPLPHCHGGAGALDWTEVLAPADLEGRSLKFIHDDILPPGASVGEHPHPDDEEFYYILSGEGDMVLDGQPHPVTAGDIAAVFPGGSHALVNTGPLPLRFLVICVHAPPNERNAP